MSFSFLVISFLIIALLFGAGQRLLDKMRLSDTMAIIILIAICIGMIIPPISIGKYFNFSIGGFLIPLGVCVYLLVRTGFSWDLLRATIGTIVTAGAIIGIQYLMPSKTPEDILIDNVWLYGIVAGIVAYALGRSRRNAFICSVLGVFLASLIQFIINWASGVPTALNLGLAGAFDTIVLSSLIAVGLAELIGKTAEMVVKKDKAKVFNFETGEFVEIDDIKSSNEKSYKKDSNCKKHCCIDGLYKKSDIMNYDKGGENYEE